MLGEGGQLPSLAVASAKQEAEQGPVDGPVYNSPLKVAVKSGVDQCPADHLGRICVALSQRVLCV